MDDPDRILDDALRSYSAHPAFPGLESRILARVPRPRWRLLWMPAAAVVALAFVAVFAVRLRTPLKTITLSPLVEAPPPPVTGRVPAAVVRPRRSRRRRTPELALVAWLDRHPEQAARLLIGDEPIVIEPLSIIPLALGEQTK